MRSAVVICVLMLVALSCESPQGPPGCVYVNGRCSTPCPPGTHSYSIGCGYKTPEPTCEEPNPIPETAMICDYSKCYCNSPTVRDQKTDQCVLLENCSKQETDPCSS